MATAFPITGDDGDDRFLLDNHFALMLGMLLDQQVPMEWAFRSPARLSERLEARGLSLTPGDLAGLGESEVEALFREKPALHRYPASMAKRAHGVALVLVEEYDGSADRVWETAEDGDELYTRLRGFPGFGDEKSRIFIALLGKRLGVAPDGWRTAAGVFGDDTPRSAADVGSDEELSEVRRWKQEQKRKGRSKQE